MDVSKINKSSIHVHTLDSEVRNKDLNKTDMYFNKENKKDNMSLLN